MKRSLFMASMQVHGLIAPIARTRTRENTRTSRKAPSILEGFCAAPTRNRHRHRHLFGLSALVGGPTTDTDSPFVSVPQTRPMEPQVSLSVGTQPLPYPCRPRLCSPTPS
jgi:hypothetical protein